MFGHNDIVGTKFFRDVGDKLYVTSLFMTLQGEGPLRGEPAFFVRLAKCNLACSFCDTYFNEGTWYTIDELRRKIDVTIDNYYKSNVPNWAQCDFSQVTSDHYVDAKTMYPIVYSVVKKRKIALVITGGEPTLQKNLLPFLRMMQGEFEKTQIETNGILEPPVPMGTIVVCSPKCIENKQRVAVKYMKPHQKTLARADCLKFVMDATPGSAYSTVPDWALEWRDKTSKQIFVSPMNIYNKEPEKAKQLRSQKNDISIEERSTVDEVISFWSEGLLNMERNKRNHEYTFDYCVEHGLIFNMQLHLFGSAP